MEQRHTGSNSFTFIINNFEQNQKKGFHGTKVLKRSNSNYNFNKTGGIKNQWITEDSPVKDIRNKKRQSNFVGTGTFTDTTGTELFQNVTVNSKKRRNRKRHKKIYENSGNSEGMQQKLFESSTVQHRKQNTNSAFFESRKCYKKLLNSPPLAVSTSLITNKTNSNRNSADFRNVKALNNHSITYKHKKKIKKSNYGKYDITNKFKYENETDRLNCRDQSILNSSESSINKKQDTDLIHFDISRNKIDKSVILERKHVNDKSIIEITNEDDCLRVSDNKLFKKNCNGSKSETDVERNIIKENKEKTPLHKNVFDCDSSNSHWVKKKRKNKKNVDNLSELNFVDSNIKKESDHDKDRYLKSEKIVAISNEDKEVDIYPKKRKKINKNKGTVTRDSDYKIGISPKSFTTKLNNASTDYMKSNESDIFIETDKISQSTENGENIFNIPCKVKKKRKQSLNPIIHISESDCEIIDYVSSNIKTDTSEENCNNTPKRKLKHKAKIIANNIQENISAPDNNTTNISINDMGSDNMNVGNKFKTKKKKHKLCRANSDLDNIKNNTLSTDDIHKNKKHVNPKKKKHNKSNDSSYLDEESFKEYSNFESIGEDRCSDISDCSKIFQLTSKDSIESGSILKSPRNKKKKEKNKIKYHISITTSEDECEIIDYVSSNPKKKNKHNTSMEHLVRKKKNHNKTLIRTSDNSSIDDILNTSKKMSSKNNVCEASGSDGPLGLENCALDSPKKQKRFKEVSSKQNKHKKLQLDEEEHHLDNNNEITHESKDIPHRTHIIFDNQSSDSSEIIISECNYRQPLTDNDMKHLKIIKKSNTTASVTNRTNLNSINKTSPKLAHEEAESINFEENNLDNSEIKIPEKINSSYLKKEDMPEEYSKELDNFESVQEDQHLDILDKSPKSKRKNKKNKIKEEISLDNNNEITHESKDIPQRSHIIFDDHSSDSSEIINSEWRYRKTHTEVHTDNDTKPLKHINKSNTSTPVTNRTNLNSTNETAHKLAHEETESIHFEENNRNNLENEPKISEKFNSSFLKKEDILEEYSTEFNNLEFVEDQRSDISDKSSKSKRCKKNKIKDSDTSTNISEDKCEIIDYVGSNSKKKKKRSTSTEPDIDSKKKYNTSMRSNDSSTDDILNTSNKTTRKNNVSDVNGSDGPLQTEICALDYTNKRKKFKEVGNKQQNKKLDLDESLKEENCQDDDLVNNDNILQEHSLNTKYEITLESRGSPALVKNETDLDTYTVAHEETKAANFAENSIHHPNDLDNEPKVPKKNKRGVTEKVKNHDTSINNLESECELLDHVSSSKKKKRKRVSSVELDVQNTPKKKHKTATMKNEDEDNNIENALNNCPVISKDHNSQKESLKEEYDKGEYDSVKPKKKKHKSSPIKDNAEIRIILDKLNTEELIKDEHCQNTELENCDISSEKCIFSDNDETKNKTDDDGSECHNFDEDLPSDDDSKLISTTLKPIQCTSKNEIFKDATNPTDKSDIGVTTNETDLKSTNETTRRSERIKNRANHNRKKKGPIRRTSVFAELMQKKRKTTKSEKQPIIPEISTDPDDLEDDIEKLKDLTVLFPFSIPPLHAIAYRTSILKKSELEKIKEMNLPIKSGPFTKEEDEMIIENWKQLCKEHDLRMNPSMFIKFPKKLKMEIKINIMRYIAHGLDDRLLHPVYIRFRNLLQKNKIKTGRYTPEEDRILLEFLTDTNSNHPFSDLAKLLNRTSCSVEVRYKRLTGNNKVIHWTPEMVDRLVKALMKITKCEKVKQLKRRKFTPKEWRKLSEKLDDIPILKLKRAWNVTIYPRLFSKEVDIREIKEQLIHLLCDRKETNWKQVNWKEIAKHFKGCTPEQIYAIFRKMTYFHVPKEKHSDLKECLKFLKYRVLRYDTISTAHKFKKFVIKNGQVTYDSDDVSD